MPIKEYIKQRECLDGNYNQVQQQKLQKMFLGKLIILKDNILNNLSSDNYKIKQIKKNLKESNEKNKINKNEFSSKKNDNNEKKNK